MKTHQTNMEDNKEKSNDKSMVTGFIVTIAAIVVVALVGVLFLRPKDPYRDRPTPIRFAYPARYRAG